MGARTGSRALASGDLSGSARGNVSALTQHCSSLNTGGMKGIGGAERLFIFEAEGVKALRQRRLCVVFLQDVVSSQDFPNE